MSLVRDKLDASLITQANAKEYYLPESPFCTDFDPLEGETRSAPCPVTNREEEPCQVKRS